MGCRTWYFVPVTIDEEYRPVPASRQDKEFAEVLAYMDWTSEGLAHRFQPEGDEIMVLPADDPRSSTGAA